jgi:hypothetical protein
MVIPISKIKCNKCQWCTVIVTDRVGNKVQARKANCYGCNQIVMRVIDVMNDDRRNCPEFDRKEV